MSNIAQMVNVIQSMILTDGDKMVLTPTYYVYKMYVPFQDAQLIPLKLDAGEFKVGDIALPQVDAIAARGKDGRIWLAVTNLDPSKEAVVRARVPSTKATFARGEVLTAPKVDSVNTFEAPKTVTPQTIRIQVGDGKVELRLPPKSVTVLELDL
jgi:alpha-N-arabinofuranosidase